MVYETLLAHSWVEELIMKQVLDKENVFFSFGAWMFSLVSVLVGSCVLFLSCPYARLQIVDATILVHD